MASLRLGQAAQARLSIRITSAGLLSVGALVSSILLSTAVIVRVAVREGKHRG